MSCLEAMSWFKSKHLGVAVVLMPAIFSKCKPKQYGVATNCASSEPEGWTENYKSLLGERSIPRVSTLKIEDHQPVWTDKWVVQGNNVHTNDVLC
jgi:hypothetical protein